MVTHKMKKRPSLWRYLLSLIALGVALYLFWPLLRELRQAAALLSTAHWERLPIVLGIQLLSYAFLAWLNELTLRPFPGRRLGLLRMAALLTAMAFIEVAIPSAGASGVVLRARLLGKHGNYTPEVSTFTLGVETFFLAMTMGSVGLLGLFNLINGGTLSWETLAAGLLLLPLLGLIWALWRLLSHPWKARSWLRRFVGWWNAHLSRQQLQALLRRLLRWQPRPLDKKALERRLWHFQAGLRELRRVPTGLFILAAAGRVFLDVLTLGACFWMFDYLIPLGALLTGYGLILLASGLAALPGGLGLADLSIPGLFARLGVPGGVALAAGLTYRLIAFWALRFIGFLAWQGMEMENRS